LVADRKRPTACQSHRSPGHSDVKPD